MQLHIRLSQSFKSFFPRVSLLLFHCASMHKMSQSIAEIKGILIHTALKVETEVKRSGVRFQSQHSLPVPCVLFVHTGLYSHSVLKQMTPGFPAIDHNKKNTPTADCSHLPLECHPLSLSLLPSPTLLFLFLCAFQAILTSTHTPNSFSKQPFYVFVSCVSPAFPLQLHCNWSLDVFFWFQHHGELSPFLSEGEGGGWWAPLEEAK